MRSLTRQDRALQCIYNALKSRGWWHFWNDRWHHGDALLFILSSAQVMYAYVLRPSTIPASYYHFIRQTYAFVRLKERVVCRGSLFLCLPCFPSCLFTLFTCLRLALISYLLMILQQRTDRRGRPAECPEERARPSRRRRAAQCVHHQEGRDDQETRGRDAKVPPTLCPPAAPGQRLRQRCVPFIVLIEFTPLPSGRGICQHLWQGRPPVSLADLCAHGAPPL